AFKQAGLVPPLPDSLLLRLFRNVNGRPYCDVEMARRMFCPFTDLESFMDLFDGGASVPLRNLPLMPLLRLPFQQMRLWHKLRTVDAEVAKAVQISRAYRKSLRIDEMSDAAIWRLLLGAYDSIPKKADQTIILGNALAAQLIGPLLGTLRRLIERWTDEPPETAAVLVTGIAGIADVACSQQLWELSRQALACADVAQALREHPEAVPDAPEWRAKWDAFLDEWGQRAAFEMEIMSPRWRDDPRIPLQMIARALDAAPEMAPSAIEARNVKRREEAERRVLRKLRTGMHRSIVRTITRILMDLTRVRQNTKAEALHYVDLMRSAALELGRRLVAAGRLDEATDVYWLDVGDLTSPQGDLRRHVEEGRAAWRRWRRSPAPRVVDANGRAVLELSRKAAVGELQGMGASPGIVRGRVRKLTDPSRGLHLGPDEILVAPYTDPTWTPLLVGARGIIAEVGSLLSHASIVSRELGIPAVVALPDAMQLFNDGDMVEIDGSTGAVRRI
ncbi:MAG: PEP-utilizing enzyme, partial [Candidatus Xenobia bacterium]